MEEGRGKGERKNGRRRRGGRVWSEGDAVR